MSNPTFAQMCDAANIALDLLDLSIDKVEVHIFGKMRIPQIQINDFSPDELLRQKIVSHFGMPNRSEFSDRKGVWTKAIDTRNVIDTRTKNVMVQLSVRWWFEETPKCGECGRAKLGV